MAFNAEVCLGWIIICRVVAIDIERKAKPEIAILRQQVGAGDKRDPLYQVGPGTVHDIQTPESSTPGDHHGNAA